MSSESDQSNLRWLRRLPVRWAIGGLLLGTVWGLVSSFLQGSLNNPVGGQMAGLIRLATIIILPLGVLGLIWGYTERAKLDRSAHQGSDNLLLTIRQTVRRQVGKAMLYGLAFGIFVMLFSKVRAFLPWDTADHIAANTSGLLGQAGRSVRAPVHGDQGFRLERSVLLRSFTPAVSAFPERVVGSACASSFSRFARRSLALRPAHSRCHQFVTH
jgi:hypothetical protein